MYNGAKTYFPLSGALSEDLRKLPEIGETSHSLPIAYAKLQ